MHFNRFWNPLYTRITNHDKDYIYYAAEVPGLGRFAICKNNAEPAIETGSGNEIEFHKIDKL